MKLVGKKPKLREKKVFDLIWKLSWPRLIKNLARKIC
jgi:Na+-driven multidrug efflux pump